MSNTECKHPKLIVGKWYISKGFIALRNEVTEKERSDMIDHNIGADRMILDGPFDTKKEAEGHLYKYRQYHNPKAWYADNAFISE